MKRPILGAMLALTIPLAVTVTATQATAVDASTTAATTERLVAASDRTPVPSTSVSKTKADCDVLIARVRSGQQKVYPRTCVSGSVYAAGISPQGSTAVAASTWPSVCSTTSTTTSGWIPLSRRRACNRAWVSITVYEVPSGRVTGTARLAAAGKLESWTTRARWNNSADIAVWSYTGTGNPEWSRGQIIPCAGDCLGQNVTYTQTRFDQWHAYANIDPVYMARGRIINGVYGQWQLTFGSSRWANSVTVKLSTAGSRCDNAISNRVPGCVFPGKPGKVRFSRSRVPAFVSHVDRAQRSGLPGRLGTTTFLSRLVDATLRDKNGAKACPSSIPRPTGMQCDEYPFRSTYQGAYFTTGRARSFYGCRMPDPERTGPSGWSRCFISTWQNGDAGKTLAAFFSTERMLSHDRFQIGFLA